MYSVPEFSKLKNELKQQLEYYGEDVARIKHKDVKKVVLSAAIAVRDLEITKIEGFYNDSSNKW
jgi:hypothetical protein